ncbi:MAG: hypothetical protein AAFW00_22840 [Bacteroidota bacterium]
MKRFLPAFIQTLDDTLRDRLPYIWRTRIHWILPISVLTLPLMFFFGRTLPLEHPYDLGGGFHDAMFLILHVLTWVVVGAWGYDQYRVKLRTRNLRTLGTTFLIYLVGFFLIKAHVTSFHAGIYQQMTALVSYEKIQEDRAFLHEYFFDVEQRGENPSLHPYTESSIKKEITRRLMPYGWNIIGVTLESSARYSLIDRKNPYSSQNNVYQWSLFLRHDQQLSYPSFGQISEYEIERRMEDLGSAHLFFRGEGRRFQIHITGYRYLWGIVLLGLMGLVLLSLSREAKGSRRSFHISLVWPFGRWLKKLDSYLAANHPVLWSIRLHYILLGLILPSVVIAFLFGSLFHLTGPEFYGLMVRWESEWVVAVGATLFSGMICMWGIQSLRQISYRSFPFPRPIVQVGLFTIIPLILLVTVLHVVLPSMWTWSHQGLNAGLSRVALDEDLETMYTDSQWLIWNKTVEADGSYNKESHMYLLDTKDLEELNQVVTKYGFDKLTLRPVQTQSLEIFSFLDSLLAQEVHYYHWNDSDTQSQYLEFYRHWGRDHSWRDIQTIPSQIFEAELVKGSRTYPVSMLSDVSRDKNWTSRQSRDQVHDYEDEEFLYIMMTLLGISLVLFQIVWLRKYVNLKVQFLTLLAVPLTIFLFIIVPVQVGGNFGVEFWIPLWYIVYLGLGLALLRMKPKNTQGRQRFASLWFILSMGAAIILGIFLDEVFFRDWMYMSYGGGEWYAIKLAIVAYFLHMIMGIQIMEKIRLQPKEK